MVEFDVWDEFFTHEWKVSHDTPTSNNNNCVDAVGPADIYRGGANEDLGSCLDDIKYWLAAHPSSGPIYVKVELKEGFENDYGMGPSAFDAAVNSRSGNLLYRPADLLGGHASLDEAAKAAGKLATATTFPAVLGALTGDPRAQYTVRASARGSWSSTATPRRTSPGSTPWYGLPSVLSQILPRG